MNYEHDHDASLSMNAQVGGAGGGGQQRAVVREQSTYMTDQDAEKLCSLFADGLSAGIGYARILDFMERQKLDPKMIQRMRYSVLELGDRLGEAFARFGILDAASRKLILVAEDQGVLPDTFKEQAKFFGRRLKRRKNFAYSLVEPAVMFCLGAFAFRNVFSNIIELTFAKDMWPLIQDILIRTGIQSTIFCVVGGFGIYAWLHMPVESSLRESAGRLLYSLPIGSKPARLQAVANFCRYFRQSINAGMDVYRSLDLAAEASNSPRFMRDVPKAIAVLESGYPMDAALRAMKDMPQEVLDYVGIGEETGRLDNQLEFLTERYDELSDEAARRQTIARMYFLRFLFIVVIMIFAVFKAVLDGGIPLDL